MVFEKYFYGLISFYWLTNIYFTPYFLSSSQGDGLLRVRGARVQHYIFWVTDIYMHDLCSIMHTSMTDLKHVSIYLYMKCTLNMRVIAGTSIELMKLKFTHAFIFFVIIIVIVIKDNVQLSTHLITYTNTFLLFPSNKVP